MYPARYYCVRFLWAEGLSTNAIHPEMRPLYGDNCFIWPAIHVSCKKFAQSRKCCWAEMTGSLCFFDDRCRCDDRSSWFMLKLIWNIYWKINVTVWCLKRSACWTSFFSQLAMLFNTCELWKNIVYRLVKYRTNWLCSKCKSVLF